MREAPNSPKSPPRATREPETEKVHMPTITPQELKVMTFNIRYGTANDGENSWPHRRDAVFEFLRSASCDVMGMQEVLIGQLHEIQAAIPYLHWVGVGREDGAMSGEYAAILYDSRKVTALSSNTFWFSDTPEVVGSISWGNRNVRICTHGSFQMGDRQFELYNIHIDHESAISRLKSVELLSNQIQNRMHHGPVFVTGDFNEGESGPAIALMGRAGFQDSYRTFYPEGSEQLTFHGWEEKEEGEKIDYIFWKDGAFSDPLQSGITTMPAPLPSAGEVGESGGTTANRERGRNRNRKSPYPSKALVVDSEIIRTKPYGRFISDHYPVIATFEFLS